MTPNRDTDEPVQDLRTLAVGVLGTEVRFRNIGRGNNEVWEIRHVGGTDYMKVFRSGREGFLREKWALDNLRAAVPIPRVRLACDACGDTPVIITIGVPGTTLDKITENRQPLIRQLGQHVAALHRFTSALIQVPDLLQPVQWGGTPDSVIERISDVDVRAGLTPAHLHPAWVANARPHRPVVSQRDCGDWQCIVSDGTIRAIVDWESVGLADPEVDLAFAAAFLRTFRDPAEESSLLLAYQMAAGTELDRPLYHSFMVAFLLQLHLMWDDRAQKFEAGKARDALLATLRNDSRV